MVSHVTKVNNLVAMAGSLVSMAKNAFAVVTMIALNNEINFETRLNVVQL